MITKNDTDKSGGIFVNDTTIRSRDISNVQEFLAILYWIRVAHEYVWFPTFAAFENFAWECLNGP